MSSEYLKMNNLTRCISLFVVILSTVCAVPEDASCCSAGQFLDRGKNKSKVCWDPKSSRNTSIKLGCIDNTIVTETLYNFTVDDAGYLILFMPNNQAQIEPKTFCVGYKKARKYVAFSMNATRAAVICIDETESNVDNTALAYCMIVSVVFLALTALIYIVLPEVRDLHGNSIIHFCISLALGLTCLAIMNLMSSYSDMNLCATRGFLTYFFLIVSFFWTNAISIQILRSMKRPFIVDYGWKEFAWYALYAWGTGALITVAMAIVNFYPGDHQKPGIGLNHCWFFGKRQQWYYMYSVMTILITINICIFIYTSILLWRHSFASSHTKALKYKFVMTIRLFVVMGVPWIFEMLSSILGESIIWVILDFVNILQGPVIFLLLVVFRRRVIKAMHRKGMLDCISDRVEKYLAVANDDEDNVIQHTMDVPLEDKITSS